MEESRVRVLSLFLRVYGWASLILFTTLLTAFTLQLPLFDTGGTLHWTVWGPLSDHVAPMLLAVYVVWSVYIIKAARDPIANALFLEFTAWANVAHGIVMIPHALMAPEYTIKFVTDIPWVFLPAVALLALRPRARRAVA
jgi:hypothetical protein